MKVLSVALIRESEENAVKSGAFSLRELMFRAGSAAAEIIMQKYGCAGKRTAVVCGRGNNGGDGCVIAEILARHGADVTVVTPLGEPKTENAAYYYGRLCLAKKADTVPQNTDIVVDALFGIGLDRPLEGAAAEAVKAINAAAGVKIAVDMPSGVESDNGKILGTAVKSDLTVTFIALKPGLLLPEGSDMCGEIQVADIGAEPVSYSYLTTEKPVFEKRRRNSHKGSFGTAVMFCGSYGMAGAAILAAKAALRSGAGILKAVLCDGIYAPFTASVPEAVCVPLKQTDKGTLPPDGIDYEKILSGCSAALAGCGLGNNADTAEIVKALCENSEIPIVIDADGINALCGSIDIIKKRKAPVILTPHPGEMARLCSVSVADIEADRVGAARKFAAEYGCVLVLKGANTVIATPKGEIFFNLTGNPGMATGGSGDLLSGIIVSLLAQGFPADEAAKAGVYLHGEAGDKAAAKRGERAMLPSDMIKEL